MVDKITDRSQVQDRREDRSTDGFKRPALDGTSAMSRKSAVVAIVFLAIANGAHAGVGDHAGGALSSLTFMSPVEKAQYYSLDDNSNYCWYNNGWQGPGWYMCGDEWLNGFGWGGPYGWNGWGGGNLIRRHGSHGIGVWHPGAPNKVFGGAASPGLGPGVAPTSPAFQGGGVAAFHRFGGGGGGFHGPGTGGAPAPPAFQGGGVPAFHGFGGGGGFHGLGPGAPASPGFHGGGVPAFHGFGGGGGFHGVGGAGGFQGGGAGAFSFGGHGGGHR
jgi:hypothetical protein